MTCGPTMRPQDCVDLLGAALAATRSTVTVTDRGVPPSPGRPWWFTERELPYGRRGVRIELEVTAVHYDQRSRFGHIQVLDTPLHGRTLVLDGIAQTTENDEFIYH